MPLNCICDELTILPNLVDNTCPTDFDAITRIAFQLTQPTASFTTLAPIMDVDSWIAKATEADDTKIVFSPATANVVIPSSEANYMGQNSNESVNGVGYLLGENNIEISGQFHSISQESATAMEALSCYSDAAFGASRLTAYLMTRRVRGRAGVIATKLDTDEYVGIEIFNFRISSVGSEGYQSKNVYNFSFTIQPDSLAQIEKVSLAFNPLALANVNTTPNPSAILTADSDVLSVGGADETIGYILTLQNNGNLLLSEIQVVSSLTGSITSMSLPSTLAAGQSVSFSGVVYTVVEDDLLGDTIDNVFTLIANTDFGQVTQVVTVSTDVILAD